MDRRTDSASLTSSEVAPLLTYQEAADVLRVHVATLYQWVKDGLLPAVRLTRRSVRIRPQDLAAFIDSKAGLMEKSRMNGPLGDRPPIEGDSRK